VDDRLRSLERAAETGEPASGAALHAARLRAGLVSEERLRLAAYLGDPAAVLLVGPPPPPGIFGLGSRVRGLAPWGRPTWVRAGLAMARCALAATRAEEPTVVRLAAEWAACPCADHLAPLAAAYEEVTPAQTPFMAVGAMVRRESRPQSLSALSQVIVLCRRPLEPGATDARLWSAVVADLLPWALASAAPLAPPGSGR
jgi:hypothetical protein